MTPRQRAAATLPEDAAESTIRDAARAVEEDRLAVDADAMRVALAGGCCARHVALGLPVLRAGHPACGPLSGDDVRAIAEAAHEALDGPDYVDDEMEETLRVVLVLCATLAGRLP